MSRVATIQTSGAAAKTTGSVRREVSLFLLLAFIILPIVMVGTIAAYGFVVWFMQIWFWGPPT